MADNLFITATEARSGKSAVSLGVMEMLIRKICRVGFFRPIINVDPGSEKRDNDIDLISTHFKLDIPYENMFGYTATEASNLLSLGKEEEIIEVVLAKYNQLAESCDFVLCEGTDFESAFAAYEFDINAEISKNLGSP
ncbi:MAG: AAA family ATPase, partial [Deltaproteobacteria bacterium]|nr:AAA family ATPase [Deltaproteobacteria bacterium]